MRTLNKLGLTSGFIATCILTTTLPVHSAVYVREEQGVILFSNIAPADAATNSAKKPQAPNSTQVAKVSESAKDFPRIARAEQQQRDLERKRILQEEYAAETQRQHAALRQGAAADIVHRHTANLAAIKREILAIQ